MKKIFLTFLVFIIVFVGLWYFYQKRPVSVDNDTQTADVLKDFSSSPYTYTASPTLQIQGTKYSIPQSLAVGTNLSSDTYISLESIPNKDVCSGDLFFDGIHTATSIVDLESNRTYSVATSSGAGAGNRYEETVYAIPGSNPCVAIRYFIHYGAIQNYEPGTVTEFDKEALIARFDEIRRVLTPRGTSVE